MAKAKFSKKILSNSFFNNIYTLYSISFIAFIQLLLLLLSQQYSAIFFFITISVLVYLYTKNMSIVLLLGILSTFILSCVKKLFNNSFEGLENNSLTNNIDNKKKTVNKSGYQNNQKLQPGLVNSPNKEQLLKQLGPENKIEKEFDDLSNVIKDNNIKSISNDTKKLMENQKELINQLKDMTPVVNEAMGQLKNINLNNLDDMFNSIKNFSTNLEKDQELKD